MDEWDGDKVGEGRAGCYSTETGTGRLAGSQVRYEVFCHSSRVLWSGEGAWPEVLSMIRRKCLIVMIYTARCV